MTVIMIGVNCERHIFENVKKIEDKGTCYEIDGWSQWSKLLWSMEVKA